MQMAADKKKIDMCHSVLYMYISIAQALYIGWSLTSECDSEIP